MTQRAILIDIDRCNGCHNCQVACKDEFCEIDWPPYTKAQPVTGQFWWEVKQLTRGSVPKVIMTYVPHGCNHCEECSAAKVCPSGAYKRRDDGIIWIDPEFCSGCRSCIDACPYEAVFFNESLDIAQKCSGCAHLLDDGWTKPRCVDACVMGAMTYLDLDDPEQAKKIEGAEVLLPEKGTVPKNFYFNLPKRFIAGEIYDEEADEVIIGASVKLMQGDDLLDQRVTDDFGDFWFKQIAPGDYSLLIEADGYLPRIIEVDAMQKDVNVGGVALYLNEE